MGKLPLQSQDCASYRRWSAKNVTNAKSVINAILMDTVSVICNQLYWIYMTNALSVSEYWKDWDAIGFCVENGINLKNSK